MKKICSILFLISALSIFSSNYKDGLYVAKSTTPSHGWISVVEITIENGEIIKAEIEGYNDQGLKRTTDTAGNGYMKSKYGFDFNDVINNFTSKFLKNKSTTNIDAIAGATLSNDIFKALSEEALKNAEIGKTQESIIHK